MSKIYNVLTANPKGHIKNLTVKGGDGVSVAMCPASVCSCREGRSYSLRRSRVKQGVRSRKGCSRAGYSAYPPLFDGRYGINWKREISNQYSRNQFRSRNAWPGVLGTISLQNEQFTSREKPCCRVEELDGSGWRPSSCSLRQHSDRRAVASRSLYRFANAADDVQTTARFIRQSLSTPETPDSLGELGPACNERLSECDCTNWSNCREP